MNLAVDIGNSEIKIGILNASARLVSLYRFKPGATITWRKIVERHGVNNAIICSVVKDRDKKIAKLLKPLTRVIYLDEKTKIPVKNNYKTPKTLGKDRLAVAVGGVHIFPKKNVLIIQTGTCITFDFVNVRNEYVGGAISPGLMMRLKALHTFTGKLPLVKPENITYRVGTTTQESILSGVVNGMRDEIDSAINDYRQRYSNLNVILTGGNAHFFESQLKNEIFVHPNLVLYGLNKILEYNVERKD